MLLNWLYYSKQMKKENQFIIWWRQESEKIRYRLLEKAKTQPLTDVEEMLLNPFTAQQARDQVKNLNQKLFGRAGQRRKNGKDT